MRAVPRGALLACLGAVLACADGGEIGLTGPRLTVRWTGADTAAFDAAATAERCDTLHVVVIRAISGDTGVGLALYDSGTLRAGTYPIRPPEKADSAVPAAALGLRWFAKTAVQGFQGDSGQVSLRRSGSGALSGTFTAKARAISGAGGLRLTGSFDGLRVKPAALGCLPPAPAGDSAAARDSTAQSRDRQPGVD